MAGILRYDENGAPVFASEKEELEWYLYHPESFDPDKLKKNEINQGNGSVIAKIPKLEGRITVKHQKDRNQSYIMLVADRYYDREKKQTRNRMVTIGSDISSHLRGMMIPNENYYEYFNREGRLINDPLARRKEQEAAEQAQRAVKQKVQETEEAQRALKKTPGQQARDADEQKAAEQQLPAPKGDERTVDQIREDLLKKEKLLDEKLEKAKLLKEKLEETQKQLDDLCAMQIIQIRQTEKDHIDLLKNMLYQFSESIAPQVKRKPESPMTLRQIRTINELLSELKTYVEGSAAEKYLRLAEEPKDTDEESELSGTTYGEMALLLDAYESTIHAYRYSTLKARPEQGRR